mgnify:CR=1 FL=1
MAYKNMGMIRGAIGVSVALSFFPLLALAQRGVTPAERLDAARERMEEKRDAARERVDERRDVIADKTANRATTTRMGTTTMRDKAEEFRARAEERRTALQLRLNAEKARRIEQFFQNMFARYDRTIGNLKDMADRVEKHIGRFEERGADVVAARERLAIARTRISEAMTALDAARSTYATSTTDADFQKSFGQKVKTVVHSLNEKVRAAHKALVEVITALKQRGGRKATTTEAE